MAYGKSEVFATYDPTRFLPKRIAPAIPANGRAPGSGTAAAPESSTGAGTWKRAWPELPDVVPCTGAQRFDLGADCGGW